MSKKLYGVPITITVIAREDGVGEVYQSAKQWYLNNEHALCSRVPPKFGKRVRLDRTEIECLYPETL